MRLIRTITFVPMSKRHLFLFAVVLVLAVLPAETWAQGCSMCKAVAQTDAGGSVYGGNQSIGAGLNKGILFMIAIPYILLFLFFRKRISSFVKEFRNAQG